MPPTSIRQVELINAQAIQWLSSGLFTDASLTSCCALRFLLPHIFNPVTDAGIDAYAKADFPGYLGGLRLKSVPLLNLVPHTDDRVFSIFPCALHHTTSSEDCSIEGYHRLAASTVFNIALTYHLQGLQGTSSSRSHLEQAMVAYQAANDLLRSATTKLEHLTEDAKLLALAIANNQGHIHELSFDLEQMQRCLKQLHAIVPYTYWNSETNLFHETAILFPRHDRIPVHAAMA